MQDSTKGHRVSNHPYCKFHFTIIRNTFSAPQVCQPSKHHNNDEVLIGLAVMGSLRDGTKIAITIHLERDN